MTNLDWALAYAAAGFRVFPVHTMRDGACCCGGLNKCKPGSIQSAHLFPVVC